MTTGIIKDKFVIDDGKNDVLISINGGTIRIEEKIYKEFTGMNYEEFIKEFQRNSAALLVAIGVQLAAAKDETT